MADGCHILPNHLIDHENFLEAIYLNKKSSNWDKIWHTTANLKRWRPYDQTWAFKIQNGGWPPF